VQPLEGTRKLLAIAFPPAGLLNPDAFDFIEHDFMARTVEIICVLPAGTIESTTSANQVDPLKLAILARLTHDEFEATPVRI
jgi:hypothetical protein